MFSAEEKIILGSALSLTGDIAATDLLSSAYAEAADALDGPALHVIVGGLVQVAERNDTESQTIEIVQPMVEELVRRDGTGAEDKAWLLNQLQKLYWGANQPSRCIEVLEEVIQLQPEEPSYHHNLALCYNALGNPAQAAVAIQRALDLDTRDPDHLSVAIRVFRAVGEVEKADRLMESLQKIDPFEAMMAESVDINEVAKTLGIEDDPHKMEELRKAFEGEGDATW